MTSRGDAQKVEVIVTPPAEIDIATAGLLTRRIARAAARHPDRVVVDFGVVTFCDSTVVPVLLASREELHAKGCALVIRNPPAALQRVAAFLGVSEALSLPS